MSKRKKTSGSSKSEGLLNFSDMRKVRFKMLYWAMFAVMLIMSLICILPTIWVALTGFKSTQEIYAIPPTLFPKAFNIGNVSEVFKKVNVLKYFGNSMILIIGCLACDIVFNGFAGYVLSRLRPIGSALIETLVFWSMLLHGISMVPLYMTFVDVPLLHINLVGQYTPIWLMSGASAFNIMLFRNFFNGIPMSYIEAARIDGCSDVRIFSKIILPLSKPILMVVTIFSVVGTWGNFMWPYLILGNTNKEPVSVMLYRINTSSSLLENEYLILLMLSILPMLVVYAFFSKYIMGGVNMSGLKG